MVGIDEIIQRLGHFQKNILVRVQVFFEWLTNRAGLVNTQLLCVFCAIKPKDSIMPGADFPKHDTYCLKTRREARPQLVDTSYSSRRSWLSPNFFSRFLLSITSESLRYFFISSSVNLTGFSSSSSFLSVLLLFSFIAYNLQDTALPLRTHILYSNIPVLIPRFTFLNSGDVHLQVLCLVVSVDP